MLNSCKVRRNTQTREIDQVVIDRPFTDERANVIYNYFRSIGIPIHLGAQAMQKELLRRGYNVDLEVAAWHGSPHLFQKFSTQFMGSGEGAQAFGWGLYFTDLEDIARKYATDGVKSEVFINGKKINTSEDLSLERIVKSSNGDLNILKEEMKDYYDRYKDNPYAYASVALEIYEAINNNEDVTLSIGKSNLYNVTLHKGKTPITSAEYRVVGPLVINRDVSKAKGEWGSKEPLMRFDTHEEAVAWLEAEDAKAEYTWLEWDKRLSDKQRDLIIKQAQLEGLPLEEHSYPSGNKGIILKDKKGHIRAIATNGKQIYEWLYQSVGGNILQSDKEVSLFLLRAGIDGIKYPAESLSRGATSDTARGFNYVVFDENAITIEEQIQFLSTPQGKVYGFVTPEGEMFLDPEIAGVNTLVHEGAHIQYKVLKTAAERGDIKAQAVLTKIQELTNPVVETIFNAKKRLAGPTSEFNESINRGFGITLFNYPEYDSSTNISKIAKTTKNIINKTNVNQVDFQIEGNQTSSIFDSEGNLNIEELNRIVENNLITTNLTENEKEGLQRASEYAMGIAIIGREVENIRGSKGNAWVGETTRRAIEEYSRGNQKIWTLEEIEQDYEQVNEGSESVVYKSKDNTHVIKKLNTSKSDFNFFDYVFDRIVIHNTLFTDTSYEIVGLTEEGDLILRQPFYEGPNLGELVFEGELESYEEALDIIDKEVRLKFNVQREVDGFYFVDDYVLTDINPFNVIQTSDGRFIIDSITFLQKDKREPFFLEIEQDLDFQITGERGAQRVQEYADSLVEPQNLFVVHNISTQNLKSSLAQGGLPAPSIAVANVDEGFTSFGEVSLIGSNRIIDPQLNPENRVFGSDIYSPTYPTVDYEITNTRALEQALESLPEELRRDFYNRIQNSIEHQNVGAEGLIENRYLRTAFALNKNKELVGYKNLDNLSQEEQEFIRPLVAQGVKGYSDIADNTEAVEKLQDLFEKRQTKTTGLLSVFFNGLSYYAQNEGKVDISSTTKNAEEYIQAQNLEQEYRSFVQELYENLQVQEQLFVDIDQQTGNRIYLEHTPENALKMMRSTSIRAGESSSTGMVGAFRALFTPEFNSIQDIQANRDSIVSEQEFEQTRQAIDDEFYSLQTELEPYKINPSSNILELMSTEASELYENGNSSGFNQLDPVLHDRFKNFIEILKTAPTEYFEAKPQRVVQIQEFSLALVPTGTSQALKDKLTQTGLEVQEYSSEQDRKQKAKQYTQRNNLAFEAAELSSPVYNQRENETDEQYKERLQEEVFARALGDNAEQYLKDLGFTTQEAKTFLQKVQEFLAEIVDWLRGKKGFQDLSVDEINRLSIREFLDRSTTSMMLGEFKASPQTNEAQEYFTREADRLPLTLAVFNTKPFQDLQGKKVNPVTIQQLLNKTGIKQIEKDLINQILSDNYSGQKRIDYDEFEATVRANIMPLERLTTYSYAEYGMDNLGDGNYGKAKTLILNAPIEHGVTGHFSGAFKASGRKNIKYVPKQLNDNTWVAVEEGYESQANENNIYQFVGTAGTKEAVDLWIIKYDLSQGKIFDNKKYLVYQDAYDQADNVLPLAGFDTEQEAKDFIEQNKDNYTYVLDYVDEQYLKNTWNLEETNKGMFGHIRVWETPTEKNTISVSKEQARKLITEGTWIYTKKGDELYRLYSKIDLNEANNYVKMSNIFHVAELQSDYFQKNNARKNILNQSEEVKAVLKEKGKLSNEEYRNLAINEYYETYATDRIQVIEIKDLQKWADENSIEKERVKRMESKANTTPDKPFLLFDVEYSRFDPIDSYSTKEEAENKKIEIDKRREEANKPLKHIPLANKQKYQETVNEKSEILRAEKEKELNKKLDKAYENYYNKLSPQEKQFIASQKEWEKRMVREAIREAALSGATSLRFPTPYTLSVIEGYLSEGAPYEIENANDSTHLEAGDRIYYAGEDYTVVDSDNTTITIAESGRVQSAEEQDIIDDEIRNAVDNDMYEIERNLKGFYTQEEWSEFRENHYAIDSVELNEVGNEIEEGVYEVSENKIIDKVEEYYQGIFTDAESIIKDIYGNDVWVSGTTVSWTDGTANIETLMQPSEYKGQGTKDSFSIEDDLDDTQQTVARKYQEIAEILKAERGDNFEVITDENGFDWYETKLTPEEVNMPVIAFQAIGEQVLDTVEQLLTTDIHGTQEYVPANSIITYYSETGEINYKRNSEGDLVMLKTVSVTPQQEESITYQQLLSIPNLSKEQALEAYKNLYSTKFYDWSNKTNEC